MTPMLAEIRMFAGNFAPRSWMFCQGQILSIAQNTALFSLLGTTYGGNGQTTFALPDLRGRSPKGTGQGPGLPFMNLGEMAGTPNQTLLITNMPAHNHTITPVGVQLPCSTGAGNSDDPSDGVPAVSASGDEQYTANATANTFLKPPTITQPTVGISGGSQPFSIEDPYLGINFIIAVEGFFPSRN
jgi:microcystin-dependent protein